MPLSAVRKFSDPDDHAALIRGAAGEFAMTGRGALAAALRRRPG